MLQKLKKLITDDSGAIVIEATVSLSVFMFMIVVVLSIVNICYAQMKMGVAVNETAKEISQYGYLYDRMGLDKLQQNLEATGKESENIINGTIGSLVGIMDSMNNIETHVKNVDINNIHDTADSISKELNSVGGNTNEIKANIKTVMDDPKNFALGLLAICGNKALDSAKTELFVVPFSKYMFKRTLSYGGNDDSEQFLHKLGLKKSGNSYMNGLDFSGSSFCEKGTHKINVVVKYKIKVLELLGNNITMTFVQHGETKCWHPSDGK